MAERVLFVHAHPDDETISTGGTIATLIDRGASVTVLTCTSGERGEVIPDELAALRSDPVAIAVERRSELSRAMTVLGVTDHRYLGQPDARWAGLAARRYSDSGMRWGARGPVGTDDLAPDALTAADAGEVSADIAAVIQAVQPDVVVSYDENGGYGHPDHVRAHHATRVAAEVMGVPFFAINDPAERGAMRVDVAPVLDRKRAALAEYRTQLTVEGDTFVTPSGAVEPITRVEAFRRVRTQAPSFAEHGIPSKIAACVVALVIGAFAGATLTVAHQASAQVAGISIPWGIIAAVIITAALIVGLRLVFGTRLVAGFGALGLLAASAFLAVQSTGGSILVPANPAGYTWTFAPVLIALVVLAWPRIDRSARVRIDAVPASKGPDLP